MNIQELICSFSLREKCNSPEYVAGACDVINRNFLRHCGSGYLLAVDNPYREPSLGWQYYGKNATISHFIAYFPELGVGVDFAARQFWANCAVPMIMTKDEILKEWKELPFGWEDASLHDEEVA